MKAFVAFTLAAWLFAGCAMGRKALVEITAEETQTVAVIQEQGAQLVKNWPTISGLIRGGLGEAGLLKLPAECVKAMDELDGYAKKEDLSEQDLGYTVGLRVQMLGQIVMASIKRYAPEIFSIISSALL